MNLSASKMAQISFTSENFNTFLPQKIYNWIGNDHETVSLYTLESYVMYGVYVKETAVQQYFQQNEWVRMTHKE